MKAERFIFLFATFFFYVFDIKSHIVGWSRFVTIYLCTWNCLYSLPLIDFFLLFFLIEWSYQYGLKSLIMFAYTYNNVCVVTPVWMLALIPFVVCQFDVFFLWDIKAMFDISINLGYKVRP